MTDLPQRKLRFRDCLTGGEIFIIVALALATAVVTAALIFSVREILQLLETSAVARDFAPLTGMLTWLAVAAVLYSILRGLEFSVSESISFRAVHRLRLEIYSHMAGMAPSQIQHRSRGSLILRLTGDLTMLRTWLSRGFSRGLVALFSAMAALLVVAYFSALLAGVVFATFTVFAVVALLFGRRLQHWTRLVRRRRSMMTGNIDEQVHSLAVVQVFGRSAGETSRLENQSQSMTDALVVEARYRGLLRGISDLAGWTAIFLSLVLGANLLLAGQIDLSSLFVTLLAIRLMHAYVRTIGNGHEYWRRAAISRAKLEDFLNSSSRPLTEPAAEPLRHRRAPISFDRVSVEGVLNEFSARVDAGRNVAIVGPSGSGKSTLLNLVARLSEPESGTVAIGDQNLADCQLSTIYKRVSMVSPQLPLMRGTLRRNLTYRNPGASEEDLQALITTCHLQDLIDALPDGLDFWLTEGGANLPLGAAQRIRFARALLGSPPILLLDRAMCGLDDANRIVFRSVIARYAGTILSITEEDQDIAMADIVWQVGGGKLVAETPADEYMRGRRPGIPAFLRLASVS